MKWNEMKWNEMKWNEIKSNPIKSNQEARPDCQIAPWSNRGVLSLDLLRKRCAHFSLKWLTPFPQKWERGLGTILLIQWDSLYLGNVKIFVFYNKTFSSQE